MSTKTLIISSVLSAFLLFTAVGVCFADASTETVRAIAPNPAGLVAHYEFEGDTVDTSGFQSPAMALSQAIQPLRKVYLAEGLSYGKENDNIIQSNSGVKYGYFV